MIARVTRTARRLVRRSRDQVRAAVRPVARPASLAAHRVLSHRLAPVFLLVLSGCSYALPILCVDRMPEDTQGVKCGVLRTGTFSGTVVCVPDTTEPWVCTEKKGDECLVWAPKSVADAKAAGHAVANPGIEVLAPAMVRDSLEVTP